MYDVDAFRKSRQILEREYNATATTNISLIHLTLLIREILILLGDDDALEF